MTKNKNQTETENTEHQERIHILLRNHTFLIRTANNNLTGSLIPTKTNEWKFIYKLIETYSYKVLKQLLNNEYTNYFYLLKRTRKPWKDKLYRK